MALNKKLHVAISTCDLDMAKEAIASGANTHSPNRCGLPALHAAISCPDNALEMVFLLLKAGVDVNQAREEDGRTALHIACEEGLTLELVETLLSFGADPNAEDFSGWSALHCASYMGGAPCVGLLMRHGAEVDKINGSGQTPLLLACESCSSKWVGRDVNYTEVVKVLLENNAAVNRFDFCEDTPLHLAVRAGNCEVARLLCTRGADVNKRSGTISGCLTPLHLCSAMGNCSLIEALINTGKINLEEESQEGLTPLMISVQSGQEGAARLFLRAGSNPHHVSQSGMTAFHLAAQEGHARILRFLLDHNSSVGVLPDKGIHRGHDGPSPLHLACHAGHVAVVRMLISSGADPCVLDSNQDTPLHVAARVRNCDVVQLLVHCKGGKLAAGMTNNRGQVPRDLSLGSSVEEILNQADSEY